MALDSENGTQGIMIMIGIYRVKTQVRKRGFYDGSFEWQYIKEKVTCFRHCPIQDRFIIIGWRWAGNSMFDFDTKESAKKWGIQSLCKRKEEFILIGGVQ